MEKNVDVVGIGSCTVDFFAIVPRLLGPEEKINADRMEIHAGGVTANNLTQVARLGASTGWLGLIGDDENGRTIQRAFTDDGMDLSGIQIEKGQHSSLTWIPVDAAGERCIYMFPNITGKITVYQVANRFAAHIKKAKHFHSEASQLPIAPIKEAMRIAKEAQVRVLFDLDVSPSFFCQSNLGSQEELTESLKLVDVLKPCKAAARELTGEVGLRKDRRQAAQPRAVAGGHHHGSGRLPDCKPQAKGERPGIQGGGSGHHRRGRCVHGRAFLRPAAELGPAARWDFCQCLRCAVLHESWRARHVEAR